MLLLGFGSGLAYAGQVSSPRNHASVHSGRTLMIRQPAKGNCQWPPHPTRSAPGSPRFCKKSPTSRRRTSQDDKSFTDDLDVDSLSMVEVAMAAEEKFGVKIPDDELPKLKTVGDAVTFIQTNA